MPHQLPNHLSGYNPSTLADTLAGKRIHGEKLYLPDSKKHLQESADARDEEHGADEVALGEGVVLQTQVLGQDERHCHESPQGREEVLWVEQRE